MTFLSTPASLVLVPASVAAAGAGPQSQTAARESGALFDTLPVMLGFGFAAIVVLGVTLAAVLAARRAAEKSRREIALRDAALNNMSQGLSVYDRDGRIIFWNARYQQIYDVPTDFLKVGRSLDDLIQSRVDRGVIFLANPEELVSRIRATTAARKMTRSRYELKDGRIFSIVVQPVDDGGWVVTHDDITEQTRAERALKQTSHFLDTVIENVPAPILVKDTQDFRYLLINRAGEDYSGLPREAMLGKTASEIYSGATAEFIRSHDRRLVETGERQIADAHAMVTPGNGTRIVKSMRLPILGDDGKAQYLLALVEDITDRARAEAQIEHMTLHDSLTDLPNRAAFQTQLGQIAARTKETDVTFAVMCIDLDRFKDINDVYGSEIGDEILRLFSQRLRAAANGAYIARLGGDEFQVIVSHGEQPSAAARVAERIYSVMSSDFIVKENRIRVGLSIGVAIHPTDGADSASLLSNASAALHRAKTGGRGAIRFFEAAMDRRLRERRSLAQDLDAAIERDELALHYQPQARIDGEIIGFEALVRWRHPHQGMIPPAVFVSIAEESGQIAAIGAWILRAACREAASWRVPLNIAVNLSAAQFRNDDLHNLVHTALTETGLAPCRLELEITETVLIDDLAGALSVLRRLKLLGVHIAMDDFGSGYASLSNLRAFPFDKIKIDRSFISNVASDPQCATIVRAVIGLGRGLGLPVLAEGVENRQQLEFLTAEGCNEMQGYLIGRPRPIQVYSQIIGRPGANQIAAAG